ncbi:MAG: hypothetical protein KGI64_03530 [Xanthomonadaceae bacterium]|nr:hypothetical protein [Xanthomonadaceae bacterium]MDE2256616.1 hypothetical protein [Xanthomonadaceae bacterium]
MNRIRMGKSIAAVLLAFGVFPALAAAVWTGSAYLADGGALAYRETHYLLDGDRFVVYTCPDGKPFARKTIHDAGDAQAPDFDMQDARWGYREGVRGRDGARTIYVQRAPDHAEKSTPLILPVDGVIDAGFDTYVHRHWDALARGNTLRFDFLVPSKRAFYAFDLRRIDAASDASHLTLRLALGAWYAFLAPHIDVTYDRHTRRLLRFAGMSNVRDAKLKNLDVRIEFPQAPVSATAEQVDAARNAPLAKSCSAQE